MDYFKLTQVFCLLFFAHVNAHTLSGQRYIAPQTATIYDRFYLIKRIEKVLDLLQQDAVTRTFSYSYITPHIYQHPLINTAATVMLEQKSVTSLYELWRVCKNYQQLYDTRFAVEFAHMLYALCSELDESSRSVYAPDQLSLYDCIDKIDACTQHLLPSGSRSVVISTAEPVNTDMIAQRYLILKRLDKSLQLLEYLHKQGVTIDLHGRRNNENLFDLNVQQFTHSRIKECIKQMYIKKNLEPLLQVADDVQQYRFVADDTFLQEMLMNLFLVYKGLLLEATSEQDGQIIVNQMSQVLEIYENIDEMPLDETLDAIDQVTDRLIALQHMEQQNQFARVSMRFACGLGAACIGAIIYYYLVW
jgi:hypothetical protein